MGSKSKSHSNADAERISNAIDEELKVSRLTFTSGHADKFSPLTPSFPARARAAEEERPEGN